MILEKQSASGLPTSNTFRLIFPEYGTRSLDIPYFDSDKHMYIVDQFVTKGGNRQITYVGVSKKLVVEVTIGFYHCWTLMNKIRLMITSMEGMKVISTFEWPQTTYYNKKLLEDKVKELATEYAKQNIGIVGGKENMQLNAFVSDMISDLFNQNIETQNRDNGLIILKIYCKQMKVCKDYVTFD